MSALDTMTDEELHTDWALASRYMERLDRETERRAEVKRVSIGLSAKSHIVDIETRYGPTTRECYCTATNGREHHEYKSPWVTSDGGTA